MPLIDFVETVLAPPDVDAAAVLLSEELLPPHAARPIAISGTLASMRIELRLRCISCPLCACPQFLSQANTTRAVIVGIGLPSCRGPAFHARRIAAFPKQLLRLGLVSAYGFEARLLSAGVELGQYAVSGSISDEEVRAVKSLCKHPDLDTPEKLAAGPYAHRDLAPEDFAIALPGLRDKSIAYEEDGHWALTDDARKDLCNSKEPAEAVELLAPNAETVVLARRRPV